MEAYRNTDTGEVWTLEEIGEAFKQFRHEMPENYDSVADFINKMIMKGKFQREGDA